MFTFFDPFGSFELLSTALCGLIIVVDLSEVFTFVMNALAFGHLISLGDFSLTCFKACNDVTGSHAITASLAKKSANSFKFGNCSVCHMCFVT